MSDRKPDSPIDELLARALDGDREAMAAFMSRYEERIRRRLRGKLSPAARSVFDTQDVFAQVVASVDQYLADGHLDVEHEEQLWKLIWTVGERVVWRQNKLASRPRPTPPAAGEKAPAAIIEISDDLEAVLGAARREDDREMLHLFLRGLTPSAIAKALGASPQAIWKRWERLRKRSQESGVRSQESGAYHHAALTLTDGLIVAATALLWRTYPRACAPVFPYRSLNSSIAWIFFAVTSTSYATRTNPFCRSRHPLPFRTHDCRCPVSRLPSVGGGPPAVA